MGLRSLDKTMTVRGLSLFAGEVKRSGSVGAVPFAMLFSVFLFSGCGYHLKGQGSSLPEEIKTIALLPFENRSDDADMELRLVAALSEEFSRSKKLSMVSAEEADVILSGAVNSLSDRPVSFTATDTAADYRLELAVESTLKSRSGEVVWKGKGLKEGQDYRAVPGDIETTRSRREEAKELLAAKMAELIHDNLFEGF